MRESSLFLDRRPDIHRSAFRSGCTLLQMATVSRNCFLLLISADSLYRTHLCHRRSTFFRIRSLVPPSTSRCNFCSIQRWLTVGYGTEARRKQHQDGSRGIGKQLGRSVYARGGQQWFGCEFALSLDASHCLCPETHSSNTRHQAGYS